jgi:hypothetical protein
MSRAGVPGDIGERVIGHVVGGVHGVYDRHSYSGEKLEALEKLAALVKSILHPEDAVVAFPKRPDGTSERHPALTHCCIKPFKRSKRRGAASVQKIVIYTASKTSSVRFHLE